MGLRQRLAALAICRAHALVVEVPGWWTDRVAVEGALRRRGWRLATSPADADVLVVCGEPGARLGAAIDRVWDQMPGPRARVAATGQDPDSALDRAAAELADDELQRDDARDRREPVEGEEDSGGDDHTDENHTREDRSDENHAGMDHGMHHGEMAPTGIPMAGGAEDRDGLEMDVLHVPLGPVLPHWPAGLVLRCVLHGDVVAEAETDLLEGAVVPAPPAASALSVLQAAGAADGAARLLEVAGWGDAAEAAVRVRDLLLDAGSSRERSVRELEALRHRVRRSRTLRALLRGLGVLDDDAVRAHGLPPDARGDVHDRLLAMLDRAGADDVGAAGDPRPVLAALPSVVVGLELAAVRLVVASLHPDTTGALRWEHAHG